MAARDARQAELEAARADLALLKAGARREDIAAAVADLGGAESNEALARKDAFRKGLLLRGNAIPKAEADQAANELDQATSRRASLQARVALLRRGARPEE